MKTVPAIIEMASDGSYSVYMDADDMDYLVTGTGATSKEAIEDFKKGYEDIKSSYERDGKYFEEIEFEFKYYMKNLLNSDYPDLPDPEPIRPEPGTTSTGPRL